MKFTMQRNRVIASKYGHAIRFEKGVPTEVPELLWPEVIAAGAVPEDEIPEKPESEQIPTDPGKRRKAIFDAIEKILLKGDRDSFTAGGSPHQRVISQMVGFTVPADERDAAWEAFQKAQREED